MVMTYRTNKHYNYFVDFSYHGHSSPLTCPKGRSRRSVAMYYYTRDRPGENGIIRFSGGF